MATSSSDRVAARYIESRAIRLDRGGIKELARELEAYLAHETPSDPWGNRILLRGRPFEIRAVDGTALTVYIQLKAVKTDNPHYIISGGLGHVQGHPVVVILVNGTLEVKKPAAVRTLHNQLYLVLLHELTHAADKFTRGIGEQVSEQGARERPEVYYNHPSEVRAYLQEIISELNFGYVEKLRRLYPQTGVVLKVLLGFASKTWQEIEPYLTERNKKLILKAVAQAYEDYLGDQ